MSMAESELFGDIPQREEFMSSSPGTARELRSAQTIIVTSLLGDADSNIKQSVTSKTAYEDYMQTEINNNDLSMSSGQTKKKVKARAKKRVKAADVTVTE